MASGKPAGGAAPPTLLGGTAIKPVERKGMEALRYFIHNPDTGEYFTRTPKSWALITLFYLIYYSLLAAFWYGMLMAFFSTLPTDRPKHILEYSLIGTNPGLGLRPEQRDEKIDSSMILVSENAPADQKNSGGLFQTATNADWAARLDKYVAHFDNTSGLIKCPKGLRSKDDEDKNCIFDRADLGFCGTAPYGYLPTAGSDAVTPCLLLKPNRLYGWKPEPYQDNAEIDQDEYLTEEAKALLKQDLKKLYVDCQGENTFDREGLIKGEQMVYYPSDQGIGIEYFPYKGNGNNYHNPTVAVQLKNLQVGRLYHIECKFWGKGIKHDRKDRLGLVHFEVLLNQELVKKEL